MNNRGRSRLIGYRWETALELPDTVRPILDRAKRTGAIVEGDTGRRCVWINGHPGSALRQARRELERALSRALPTRVSDG